MEVNELIERLMAIANYAKDIHYTCSEMDAYSKHLFMDLVHDGIDDFIDSLKENAIMGNRELPLASKKYMEEAIKFIPDIKEGKDRENFISLWGLIDDTRRELKEMKVNSRGVNSIIDSIGEHLDKMSGLLYMQTRITRGLNESEEDIEVKNDHEAATETPVDRKEFKAVIPEVSPSQKTALKYDEENLLVAEESNVDRLYNKIKEMEL